MATTPPPPTFLRLPPTPRHGTGYDQYEPYSTRHSARLASQRATTQSRTTPPPVFPASHGLKSVKKQKTAELGTLSPPGSPNGSPRKKRSARIEGCAQAHSLGLDDSDPFDTTEPTRLRQSFRPTMTEGMLPTPAKTPRKKAVSNVGATARALFPPSSGSKKKAKKHTGFSLDSFTEDPSQSDAQIQIYTDSRDRIPELDESESNPFYQKPAPNTNTRTSRRKAGTRDREVDEALKREDGMVYVFRGKKKFLKFQDHAGSDEEEEDDDDDLGLLASRPDLIDQSLLAKTRPLTRSSIKPRVLFPTTNGRVSHENHGSDADEEAATDIEDNVLPTTHVAEDMDHAVDVSLDQRPVTPPPNITATTPPSPGATTRSLRSRAKREDLEHGHTPTATETKNKRSSPFDAWKRKKPTPPVTGVKSSKKRDADFAGSPGGPVTKKTRANRAIVASP